MPQQKYLQAVPHAVSESAWPIVGLPIEYFKEPIWRDVIEDYFATVFDEVPAMSYRLAARTTVARALDNPDGFRWGSKYSPNSKLVTRRRLGEIVTVSFRDDADPVSEDLAMQIRKTTLDFNHCVAERLVASGRAVTVT